jgi:hypothetical protein
MIITVGGIKGGSGKTRAARAADAAAADAEQLWFPPVECCFGTNPSQAAKSRPLRNVAPFPMAATKAVAVTMPINRKV